MEGDDGGHAADGPMSARSWPGSETAETSWEQLLSSPGGN